MGCEALCSAKSHTSLQIVICDTRKRTWKRAEERLMSRSIRWVIYIWEGEMWPGGAAGSMIEKQHLPERYKLALSIPVYPCEQKTAGKIRTLMSQINTTTTAQHNISLTRSLTHSFSPDPEIRYARCMFRLPTDQSAHTALRQVPCLSIMASLSFPRLLRVQQTTRYVPAWPCLPLLATC